MHLEDPIGEIRKAGNDAVVIDCEGVWRRKAHRMSK
jgi:hypothetical protein